MKKFFIVAGDPSGDQIASQLIISLKNLDNSVTATAVGGNSLLKVCDNFLANIVKEHALGFAISPIKILRFRNILNNTIIKSWEKDKPDAVIVVDFYGFNSCVAKAAKKMGIKVFYYVTPQFWATRPGRADKLRDVVDLFLCLFPFEIKFYEEKKLAAKFVGHPLLDKIPDLSLLPPAKMKVEPVIGLIPGSRPEEIRRHLPIMLEACNQVSRDYVGLRLVLFTVPHVSRDFYKKIIEKFSTKNLLVDFVEDENFQWRMQLDVAITASGMETLENALLGIPMIVMYKTNWITYYIARMLINIPHLAMPNLLAGKELVPEFIQMDATAKNITPVLIKWLKDSSYRENLRQELLSLRKNFGDNGASERAAKTILEKVA